jgi:ABC-type proline/glycine betaine transport system ATPase subunit
MIQAEADVLLIDEVLAVGDAAFQQKCEAVFDDMRKSDRTIVLVTHDMTAIETYCDRGMLINDGELLYIGDPQEVGRRYYRENFANAKELWGRRERGVPDLHAAAVDAWLEDAAGERVETIEPGEPLRMRAVLRARHELVNPEFGFECKNVNGVTVFAFKRALEAETGKPSRLAADQLARISATINQSLVPGTYYVRAWVVRDLDVEEIALQFIDILKFEVVGGSWGPGIVVVDPEVEINTEENGPS